MRHAKKFDFLTIIWIYISFMINVNSGCQVQFYDIPFRHYHISKAYDQVITWSPGDCRDRCAVDNNCWAFTHYGTTNLCALTNLSVDVWNPCAYCFSARRVFNCIEPTTIESIPATTTESESTLCTCTCDEDSTVDNITKLNERISSLQLVKSTLSRSRRKLTSADDQRPSAKGVGVVGVFILVMFVAVIVFFDALTFCSSSYA